MKDSVNKKGFTLIEMLIVISIISLLAVMAVSSFGAAQKKARLDIAVDSIMSVLKEQQGKAKTGRQGSGGSADSLPGALCYGVVFQTAVPYVQTVTVPYRSVANDKSAKADYCDAITSPALVILPVTEDIVLKQIQQGSADAGEKLVLMFKPPLGSVLEASDFAAITQVHGQPAVAQNPVQIFINQQGNDPQDERVLQFDAFSGQVSRVNPAVQNPLPVLP